MPSNSKRLEGHIAFGSFVYLSIHSSCFSCEQDILRTILARALKLGDWYCG